jgi:hypothetical protein
MRKFTQEDIDYFNEDWLDSLDDKTPLGIVNFLQEFIDDEDDQENIDFWEDFLEQFNDVDSLVLYDTKERGFTVIDEVMRTLHYDNGQPLTTDEYSYFDHYDRDQDYWGFFEDEEIDHFELGKDGNLVVVLEMTRPELEDSLKQMYDGSSYEHDFGSTWDELSNINK